MNPNYFAGTFFAIPRSLKIVGNSKKIFLCPFNIFPQFFPNLQFRPSSKVFFIVPSNFFIFTPNIFPEFLLIYVLSSLKVPSQCDPYEILYSSFPGVFSRRFLHVRAKRRRLLMEGNFQPTFATNKKYK